MTAYESLTRAGVTAGQKVLIQGGAGGVGHLAIQLAKAMGADVTATGTGAAQLDLIKSYGATPVDFMTQKTADYVGAQTGGAGFDVVFDTVGGANLTHSFEAAKLNGHVSSTVAMLELDLTPAHFKGLSLHVVFMLIPMIHDVASDAHGAILKELAAHVEAGALKPMLDTESFGLSDVGKAHDRLASGKAIGKVVIELKKTLRKHVFCGRRNACGIR